MSKLKLGLLLGVYLATFVQVRCNDSSSSEPTGLWYAMRNLSLVDKFYTVASIVTGQDWLMPEDDSPVNVTGLSTGDSSLQIRSRRGNLRVMPEADDKFKKNSKLDTIIEVDELDSEPE